MLQAAGGDKDEGPAQYGRVLLGPGWNEVENVDDLDPDEYETDEEVRGRPQPSQEPANAVQEIYVTLDLGALPEGGKPIATESQFQLIVSDDSSAMAVG